MDFFVPNSYIIKLLNEEIQYKKTSTNFSQNKLPQTHPDNDNKITFFVLNSLHYFKKRKQTNK